MGEFEFEIELLISLVEARPVLWDMTDGENFVFIFKKTSKLW
jgi:hypothetical protein